MNPVTRAVTFRRASRNLRDMADARASADRLETLTASDYWPFPSYAQLLFSV